MRPSLIAISRDGKRIQHLISQGSRQLTVDGQISIRNEDEFDVYRVLFINAGFSNDEAFFLLALLALVPRLPPVAR
jgi:hypothetical protein